MGKRGPKPDPWQRMVERGRRSEARKRQAFEENGVVRLKAWDRDRPGKDAILDPEKSILLIPGYDPHRESEGCEFRPEEAARAIGWFHEHLTHVKGELAGTAYVLEPVEQGIIANLLGWFRADGTRRFRKALVYVPRKFGKTLLCAGISLYGFFEEDETDYVEGGVESYAAAYTRDQAKLLWGPAKQIIRNDENLTARCRIYQHSIVRYYKGTTEQDGSYFQAISADANSAHGLNPYFYAVDELHTQKTPDLLDTLDTGTGARRSPLGVRITTADFAGESICNEEYEHARRVRDGVTPDMEYLPVIFEASESDDPFAESTWAKANPKYPKTPKKAYLESQAKKAQENPRFLNTFLRLHLNIRTNADVAWFGVDDWNACNNVEYGALRDSLRGETCTGGLDLSTTTDLTAFSLFFPERSALLCWFWMPRDTAVKAEKRDRVPYLTWERQGFVEMTDGNEVDYVVLRAQLLGIIEEFKPQKVAVDRFNATALVQQLIGDGVVGIEMFGQGFLSMSGPSKELERLVVGRHLEHGGQPVLAWNASNVMLKEDPAGNIKPDKSKSTGRIDGIVAAIMAIGLAITTEGPSESVYEQRGVLIL